MSDVSNTINVCTLHSYFFRGKKNISRLIGGDFCRLQWKSKRGEICAYNLVRHIAGRKSSHRISHGSDFVHSVEEVVNTKNSITAVLEKIVITKEWPILWVNVYCNASAFIILQDKVVKFANYFLSRKHVHQLRSAYQLVSVIKTLTDNQVSLYPVWFYTVTLINVKNAFDIPD